MSYDILKTPRSRNIYYPVQPETRIHGQSSNNAEHVDDDANPTEEKSVTVGESVARPSRKPEHLARIEIEATNDRMANVVSLFRDPPTQAERVEHKQILETLPDNQRVGVGILTDIIRNQKGGEILLTRDHSTESSVWLMPVLMTSDWFRASDMLYCEIPLPEHLLPEKNKDLSEEQLREKVSDANLQLKQVVVKALNVEPSKVSVKAPKVTGHTGDFTVVEGKQVFEVKVNAKGLDLQEPITISNVPLERIEHAKANQMPVFLVKPDDFDPAGDFQFPCKEGEIQQRGGMEYKQPCSNWVRIGLSVSGRYDNGNDDWLGMDGESGEWTSGFHGSSSMTGNQEIVASREIRPGERQMFRDDTDVNTLSDTYGEACGDGAYFADDIEVAKRYATTVKNLKCVFQARLCPSKVRIPSEYPMFRIVNEAKYARPYGICVEFRGSGDTKKGKGLQGNIPEERSRITTADWKQTSC